MNNHPKQRRYKVTILRIDGTPWVIDGPIKHVIIRSQMLAIHKGDHGTPSWQLMLVPLTQIDHVYVEEYQEP